MWGLEAVKTGVFAPPALIGAMPFAGLRALVDEAIAALEALTPAGIGLPSCRKSPSRKSDFPPPAEPP